MELEIKLEARKKDLGRIANEGLLEKNARKKEWCRNSILKPRPLM